MSNKVYYMPYHPNHPKHNKALTEYGDAGPNQKNKLMVDNDLAKGKQAVQVWYQENVVSPLLAGIDQIYIRGHGAPGWPSICGGEHGEDVSAEQVADRVRQSGLSLAFAGKVKLYSCHSAEHGGVPGALPFAQRVANAMRALGYQHCSYFGYLGGVDSFPKQGADGQLHRFTRGYVKGNDGVSTLQPLARAKDARIQFHPQINIAVAVKLSMLEKFRLRRLG